MPARFDSYRIRRGDNLGDPEFWNRRLRDVDARTAALEEQKTTLDAVIDEGRTVFREKANDVLLPLIQEVHEIADVGVMLRARSQTEHQVSVGGKTFVIDEGQRLRFAAPAYVAVYRMESPQAAMLGEVVSYDSGTGELTVDIDRAVGSGAHGGWTITAASPSDTAEAIADVLAAVDLVAADRQTAVEAAALASDKAGLAAQKADESAAFAASVDQDAGRAEAAVTQIETIYSQQSQVWLGSAPVDPISDLNGDPLVAGATYWNTAEGKIKVYDGASWVVSVVPVGSEVTSIFGRTGNVGAQVGDYSAEKITVSGVPGLAGGDVQAVLGTIGTALSTHAGDIADRATSGELASGLAGKADLSHGHSFASLSGKPTTLAGYGIGDARTASQIAADIAAAVSAGVADRAEKSYVDAQISALIGGAPAAALDTIAELAAALTSNDSDIAAILSSLASKLPAASYTAADVLAKLKTVDGIGSGLDADLLRGLAPYETAVGNTLVRRDASGDIRARMFRSDYDTTNSSIGYVMTQVDTGNNNYLRPSTPAQLVGALNSAGGIDADKLGGVSAGSFVQTSRAVTAGTGLVGGGTLAANRTLSINEASLAEVSAGTNGKFPDAATVKAAIADALIAAAPEAKAVGAVGTYALLFRADAAITEPGDVTAGSGLRYADTYQYGGVNVGYKEQAPPGTWRCMGVSGYYNNTTGGGIGTSITLWLRIA